MNTELIRDITELAKKHNVAIMTAAQGGMENATNILMTTEELSDLILNHESKALIYLNSLCVLNRLTVLLDLLDNAKSDFFDIKIVKKFMINNFETDLSSIMEANKSNLGKEDKGINDQLLIELAEKIYYRKGGQRTLINDYSIY